MFWILRRTGAVNFFNSINNNYSAKSNSEDVYNNSGKSKSRKRFRYGRLSMDSDELNFNNKSNNVDCATTDLLVGSEKIKYAYCGNCLKSHDVDENGNTELASHCVKNHFITGSTTKASDNQTETLNMSKKSIDQKTINRLQLMAMSDDEDFDESLTCNVCDRAFYSHRQLASHQQKKRHFGCSGCDTLFPSLMLLEHHKEEYEHWSDSEEYQRPCCRRNRRDDFDYSDSETCTSDAESEDLERLL